MAQLVKNLLAMREIWVQSLGWEGPLEKEKATHSSILAWRIPWTEKPGGLQSMGSQRVRHDWVTFTFTLVYNPKGIHFRRKTETKIDQSLKNLNLTSNNLDL